MTPRADQRLILGIPVDNLNMTQAVDGVMNMIEDFQVDGRPRLVATANVDFIVNANERRQQEQASWLRRILRTADMVTADGMPLVWLSQLMGVPLEERVTGADMVPALAKRAAETGKSIYLLGGKEGAGKRTAQILQTQFPTLKIAGYGAPMIDLNNELENTIEIARINVAKPDILLIALGNPKQEFWFDRYRELIHVPVSIGVGGTFEFIAGMTSRAPIWMQKTGLEWIYRMSQDPRRLVKRYVKGLFSFNTMALSMLWNRMPRFKESQTIKVALPHTVELPALLTTKPLNWEITTSSDTAEHIRVNLAGQKRLEHQDVLALLQLITWAQAHGLTVTPSELSKGHQRTLTRYRLKDLFHTDPNTQSQPMLSRAQAA